MGGRVAIEVGLRYARRASGALGLLAPSLAWLRERPWAPLLRCVPPQLGAVQPAPRGVVERDRAPAGRRRRLAVDRAGVDEFLRAYLTPAGRVAFYAAARNIYLEEPHGSNGFWTRLPRSTPPSLFVWGRRRRARPARLRGARASARCRRPSTSSSTAGTCRSSSARAETHAALGRFFGG